jgi:hypothetical protein
VTKVSVHALQNQQTLTTYTESVSNKFEMDPYSGMMLLHSLALSLGGTEMYSPLQHL